MSKAAEFWEAIPMGGKIAGVVIAGFIGMFTMFETKAGSGQKWAEHNQAIVCRQVYELQKDVRGLTERLQFDNRLTQEQRNWIHQQIANLQAEIQRLDPNGVC